MTPGRQLLARTKEAARVHFGESGRDNGRRVRGGYVSLAGSDMLRERWPRLLVALHTCSLPVFVACPRFLAGAPGRGIWRRIRGGYVNLGWLQRQQGRLPGSLSHLSNCVPASTRLCCPSPLPRWCSWSTAVHLILGGPGRQHPRNSGAGALGGPTGSCRCRPSGYLIPRVYSSSCSLCSLLVPSTVLSERCGAPHPWCGQDTGTE